jgi:hypothetical protein
MTARKRWIEKLECSKCGNAGIADLSQADSSAFLRGETAIRVDDTPLGFRYFRRGNHIIFACSSCKDFTSE